MQRILSFTILAVFSIVLSTCGDPSGETTESDTPKATQPKPSSSNQMMETPNFPPRSGADITFAWEEHDFGTIWDNKTVECTFPFMNHGTKTLVIKRMHAGCGCTSPVADKTILKPGEQSIIRVKFDPTHKSKKQDKKVTILSNASLEPEKSVWIRSSVKQIVTIDPFLVQLGEMTMGVPSSKVFNITSVLDDFVITEMKGIGKHGHFISGEELESLDGEPRQIQINVSPNMPWGAFHSQLSVTGSGTMPDGEEIEHTVNVFANGKTYGKLRADDYIIRLGSPKKGGSYHKRIRLFRSDGKPFEVTTATVFSPTVQGMNATAVQIPSVQGHEYEIIVSGTLPPSFVGQIGGELLVKTDVVGEEVLRFRITGVIPKNRK
ncbi:MAG: DUF1573 domain-containing protein [Phycisphaerales bacterium]|nr:DUF1573 domain-containing protein [Phycisphaerales bacterium]MDP6693521.1 DUF1573 domain-containing protein [Phycisphaerales bacterium]